MTSVCVLYYAYGDTKLLMRLIDEGEGTREQKDHNRANLRRVVQYCMNETDCRRTQVLQYFGEQFPRDQCHKTCDNCMAPKNVELRDVTGLAKDAMGLVKAIQKDKGVTMLYAIDVFRGSKTQKVRLPQLPSSSPSTRFGPSRSSSFLTDSRACRPVLQIAQAGHDKLEHAGKGANIDRGDAERLFQLLAAEQILGERYERNGLGFTNAYVTLGPRAPLLLTGKLPLQMGFTKGGKGAKAAGAVTTTSAAAKGKGKASTSSTRAKDQAQRTINESFDHEEYGGEFMDELLDEVEGVYDVNEEEWCVSISPLQPVVVVVVVVVVAPTIADSGSSVAQGRLRPPPRAQVDRRGRHARRRRRPERLERRHHRRTPRQAHRHPREGASASLSTSSSPSQQSLRARC